MPFYNHLLESAKMQIPLGDCRRIPLLLRFVSRQSEFAFFMRQLRLAHFLFCKGGYNIPDYKKMYFHIFNKITDVIEELENNLCGIESVVEQLKQLQLEGEDMYIDTYDEFPEDE